MSSPSTAVLWPAQPSRPRHWPSTAPTDPSTDCGELSNEFGREERAMVGLSSLLLWSDTSPRCVHYLQIQWQKGKAPLSRGTLLLHEIFLQHWGVQGPPRPIPNHCSTSLCTPACIALAALWSLLEQSSFRTALLAWKPFQEQSIQASERSLRTWRICSLQLSVSSGQLLSPSSQWPLGCCCSLQWGQPGTAPDLLCHVYS